MASQQRSTETRDGVSLRRLVITIKLNIPQDVGLRDLRLTRAKAAVENVIAHFWDEQLITIKRQQILELRYKVISSTNVFANDIVRAVRFY